MMPPHSSIELTRGFCYHEIMVASHSEPREGRYRHYKGQEYRVIGCARHTETKEELVVYRALYGEELLWARPKQMFLESVNFDGRDVPRFQYLGPDEQE